MLFINGSSDPKQMTVTDDANLFVGHVREYKIRLQTPPISQLSNMSRSFYKLQFDSTNFSNVSSTPDRFGRMR